MSGFVAVVSLSGDTVRPWDETSRLADHYRALPPEAPRMELLDGEYVVAPSPSERHQSAVGTIYRALGNYLESNPLGKLYVAPLDVYL